MKPTTIVTHSGNFHADDVFALATLRIKLGENIEIIRTRDESTFSKADYVVDVGGIYDPKGKRFDHHQVGGAGIRENGIPYAAFGLVWKEYGIEVSGSEEISHEVERRLVQVLDASDNGVETFLKVSDDLEPYTLPKMIHAFNPSWTEDVSTSDHTFFKLVIIAQDIILREIKNAQDKLKAKDKVIEAYNLAQDKRLIILDGHYPAMEFLSEYPEPLFIIRPDISPGVWKLNTMRDNLHEFKNKKNLPEAWGGKRGEELVQVTGVADAAFCHRGLFMATAGSKEGAIKLAQLALEA
jgi:uncharacterized UPF0160 family protein